MGGVTELADTPEDNWNVSWVVDGDDYGALGALYWPRYFHPDGIVVHCCQSVPAYPAYRPPSAASASARPPWTGFGPTIWWPAGGSQGRHQLGHPLATSADFNGPPSAYYLMAVDILHGSSLRGR